MSEIYKGHLLSAERKGKVTDFSKVSVLKASNNTQISQLQIRYIHEIGESWKMATKNWVTELAIV